MEKYDQFPINLLEEFGTINLKSFAVIAEYAKIWENGIVVNTNYVPTEIEVKVIDDRINYEILNPDLGQYLNLKGSFIEKSENRDRILLSIDLLSGGVGSYNVPDFLSVFYLNSKVRKIEFSLINPSRLIEFVIPIYDTIQQKSHLQFAYEDRVRLSHLMAIIAISKSNTFRNQYQRQIIDIIMKREHMTQSDLDILEKKSNLIGFTVPDDKNKRILIIEDMVRIMLVGGVCSDEEKSLIGNLAYHFGFDPNKTLDYLIKKLLH
nr:hypothetical protein [Parabacteroides goldsteinii]